MIEANDLQKLYDTDPEYSLEVDPTNKFDLCEEQRLFIKFYVQYKNIPMAATLANIDDEMAKAYYIDFATQEEIRRINRAMYHRQFSAKLLSLDAVGGWLSSLLTDEVPVADQLKSTDKLRVAQMIIDLNKLKMEAMEDPNVLTVKDFEVQVKDLSVDTIQKLLSTNEDNKQKEALIAEHYKSLRPEEEAYLKTLSISELLDIIQSTEVKENVDKQTEEII